MKNSFMRLGVKRFSLILILMSAPLVYAEPISLLQQTQPFISKITKTVIQKVSGRKPTPRSPVLYGVASWYSENDPFINKHTANGEIFDDSKMTCASWDFPFGTYLKVKNVSNGKSLVCRVNDRGPSKRLDRLIDLSRSAFLKIASLRQGLVRVSVTPVRQK